MLDENALSSPGLQLIKEDAFLRKLDRDRENIFHAEQDRVQITDSTLIPETALLHMRNELAHISLSRIGGVKKARAGDDFVPMPVYGSKYEGFFCEDREWKQSLDFFLHKVVER
jgi:hypothetical protein